MIDLETVMINKNGNNSFCAFSEQIVSYIYGESEPQKKFEFESHLKNCSNCADELAGFELVRSSVLDWRTEDFSILQTPFFDIPAVKSSRHISPAKTSNKMLSWIGEIRKIFSFNPKLATAAFAVLIVCVGAAIFTFEFSGNSQTAQNENNKKTIEVAVSPTIEIGKNPEEIKIISRRNEKSPSQSSENNSLPSKTTSEKQVTTSKSVIKVSDIAPKNNTDISIHGPKNNIDDTKKTPTVKKQKAPRLNDEEDEEDKTIRLADLFDELDTK